MNNLKQVLMLFALITASACQMPPTSAVKTSSPSAQPESISDPKDPCVAEMLAEDAALDTMLGEQGNPKNWQAFPPDAIVASTYLRFQPGTEAREVFDSVVQPINQVLMAPAEGLMSVSFMASEKCNEIRTLTVWKNEADMMTFVIGDAHLNAISKVSEISRGGSITGHWSKETVGEVSWKNVISQFKDHEGPVY